MADNLRKYTTQEVLNKVFTDSSGNSIGINSSTTKETLNAVFSTSDNSLNVALSGGSISGDVTISGDLTVVGSATNTYDEQIQGIVQIVGATGTGATPAGTLQLTTADTTIGDDDQLGRIEFLAASEADGSDSQLVGASIVGEAEATFAADNNSTALVFSTNTSAAATERMRITSAGNVSIGNASPSPVNADYSSLQIGGQGLIFSNTTAGADKSVYIGNNVFRHTDGTWDTIANDEQMLYEQHGGKHYFYIGAAHASVSSLATKFVIDTNSRISLSNNGGEATNTIFGYQAGNTIHSSSGMNTFVGHQVADTSNDANADENTAVGHLALSGLTSGAQNVAIGSYTGINITSGGENVLIGRSTGNAYNSSQVTAVGTLSAGSITSGNGDGTTAFGYYALKSQTTGQQNTAVGSFNSDDITSGSYNTAVGRSTLASLTTGSNNIAIGRATFNTSADDESYNIAIGNGALGSAKQDGTVSATDREVKHNIAIGQDALTGGTLAGADHLEYNIAIGSNALNSTGTNDHTGTIAIGYNSLTALTSGGSNTSVGFGSMDALTTGSNNTGLGDRSLSATDDGANNTAVGAFAMESGNCGDNNTAVGANSLKACTGSDNIAIGKDTMVVHTTGGKNVAIGHQVMYDTDAGSTSLGSSENVFIGYQVASGGWTDAACNHNVGIGNDVMRGALDGATQNVAVGSEALMSLTTGDGNVALGYKALEDVNTGGSNIAIGNASGISLTGGDDNVAIGTNCLYNSTSVNKAIIIGKNAGNGVLTTDADGVIGIGFESLSALTSGAKNVALGYQSMASATEGDNNIAIGYQALDAVAVGESDNIAIGYGAMGSMDEGTAGGDIDYNIAIGTNALIGGDLGGNNRQVQKNIAIGHNALDATSNGEIIGAVAIGHNALSASQAVIGTALGYLALEDMTSGVGNTALGYRACEQMTTGDNNVAVGHQAMNTHKGSYNVAIGYQAMDDTDAGGNAETGQHNVFIGTHAGGGTWGNTGTSNYNIGIGSNTLDDALDDADGNLAIGHQAATSVTSGIHNLCLGYQSGGSNLTANTGNVFIGTGAGSSGTSINDSIVLKAGTDGLNDGGAETIRIGVDSDFVTLDFGGGGETWSHTSDERIKKEINDTNIGLDFINDLRPVTFKRKAPSEYPKSFDTYNETKTERNNPDKINYGFIAQEVKESMDKVNHSNFTAWIEREDGCQELGETMLIVPLVKAIQELTAKVEDLESKLK